MPLGRVSIKSKPLPSAVFEEVVNLIVAERNTTQLLSLRKFDGRLNVSESQGGIWKSYTPVAMRHILTFYSKAQQSAGPHFTINHIRLVKTNYSPLYIILHLCSIYHPQSVKFLESYLGGALVLF